MARRAAAVCGVLLLASMGVAATYTVTNDHDSGVGSLRWAIGRANSHAGADTITFAAYVGGSIIQPLTPLPAVTDDGTIVDGDLNDDSLPDIGIDGYLVDEGQFPQACGVTVMQADGCRLRGLVVTRWPWAGIWLEGSLRTRVTACHVGVNRGGTQVWPNGGLADIELRDCSDCVIGGTSAARRNVLAGGFRGDSPGLGVSIEGGARNKVIGNYIGIRRDGSAAFGDGHLGGTAVYIEAGSSQQVGGTAAGSGNVIGGVQDAVRVVRYASGTRISGNLIGLAANGDSLAPVDGMCVKLIEASTRTVIGGTTAAARNVFAGNAPTGIYVHSDANGQVLIQGNRFGTNAAGTAHRGSMQTGVEEASAGREVTIGGSTAAAGNLFAMSGGYAVNVSRTGRPTIRENVFGVFSNGQDADALLAGVLVGEESSPTIRDNHFANALGGVSVSGSGCEPGIFGNSFRTCAYAVYIQKGASCRLGDLSNAETDDDGGNLFSTSNTWDIYNSTANDIRAEGNDFVKTSYVQISAKIHDQVDNGALGLVDFDPLMGGISPTGGTRGRTLPAITAASARQTAASAEVIFTLSAPARVHARALNIAGRPVATLCRDRDCAAGANRLLWNAMGDRGLPVPNGLYLIEVTAAAPDGTQSRAVAQVSFRR